MRRRFNPQLNLFTNIALNQIAQELQQISQVLDATSPVLDGISGPGTFKLSDHRSGFGKYVWSSIVSYNLLVLARTKLTAA
ncbi:MAG: hypothetical protein BWK76_07470 [Desulfobulbaceae bacterium A2]|nr:MAG: hypothetical protein BWK76_07470 [Desulfobulbaceae bacterium A2]